MKSVLLGPAALRRRLPLILALVLAAMMIGAAFAALQTPVFRSKATVSGPADLATIVRSGEVAEGFRTRVAAAYGDDFASTVVAFASESGQRIELATESPFAGITEDLTRLYTEAVLAARPDVSLDEPARFPTSAHSPNLRRTALVSFLVGATLGWVAAVVLERRAPTSSATRPTEASPTFKPIATVAPLERKPPLAEQHLPERPPPKPIATVAPRERKPSLAEQHLPATVAPRERKPSLAEQHLPERPPPEPATSQVVPTPRIATSSAPRPKTGEPPAHSRRPSASDTPRVVRLPDQK